jgi:hypothetical protein
MEERIPIEKLDDIFKYDFRLKEAVELYEKSV